MRALLSGCVYLFALGCTPQSPSYPSDTEMIKNLEGNISEFEELVSMFRNDTMEVVHPIWIQPKGRITEERWEEYRKHFERLHLDGGMRSWGGESIWFIGYSSGFVFGGSGKGYMYKPEIPAPLYQSLDSPPKDLPSNVRGYRFVREHWYLEYSWDD